MTDLQRPCWDPKELLGTFPKQGTNGCIFFIFEKCSIRICIWLLFEELLNIDKSGTMAEFHLANKSENATH